MVHFKNMGRKRIVSSVDVLVLQCPPTLLTGASFFCHRLHPPFFFFFEKVKHFEKKTVFTPSLCALFVLLPNCHFTYLFSPAIQRKKRQRATLSLALVFSPPFFFSPPCGRVRSARRSSRWGESVWQCGVRTPLRGPSHLRGICYRRTSSGLTLNDASVGIGF